MAILAIGATGGIFANPNLIKHIGQDAGVDGILVVLMDLMVAAIVVYRGRFRTDQNKATAWRGIVDLFWGMLSVALTAGVIYKTY